MTELRAYQHRACVAVRAAWREVDRVCLVAPTGSGKTVMGLELCCGHDALWITHRIELIEQLANHPAAPQSVSVQSLLSSGVRPACDLLVWDECHHVRATDWGKIQSDYHHVKQLGLTATPERHDGRALGDVYQALVVAATYSELISAGYLVDSRVFQPPDCVHGLAVNPVVAYEKYCEGRKAFAFFSTVEQAIKHARRFNDAGVQAAAVHAKSDSRQELIEEFRSGNIRVLCNVQILTEGVDIPDASALIIGRKLQHIGSYLQVAGRVVRPAPGKTDAIIVDLVGATLQHGSPTENRQYSLDGSAITRESCSPLRNCLQCGLCYDASREVCPRCGYRPAPEKRREPRIYSMELREVFAGKNTPAEAKARELQRLMDLMRLRGWSVYAVVKMYRELFGTNPVLTMATDDEKRAELSRLIREARSKGYKPGRAAIRYRDLFGSWPPRRRNARV